MAWRFAENWLSMKTSMVPSASASSHTVYEVLDGSSRRERVWTEIDHEGANEETVVRWLIEGKFSHPLRVIAVNTDEGWARDLTHEIAWKLLELNRSGHDVGAAAREFVKGVTGECSTVPWPSKALRRSGA